MYSTAQKGVKILGTLMQQVRIEMKRIVRLGLHLFTESFARVVIETKHHSLTDFGDCKIYTVNVQLRTTR